MEQENLRQYIKLVLERVRSKAPGIRWDVKTQDVRKVTKFDLKEFKSFDELDDMRSYASNRLEMLGEGSAREVYVLTNKQVLKIASNEAGLDQNKEEVDVYTNPLTKSLVAKIYDFDKDYFWIASEMVKPCQTEKECDSILGLKGLFFSEFIVSAIETHSLRQIERYEEITPKLEKFFNALIEFHDANDELLKGDLKKFNSWGVSADGRLVLLDYGFSREVYAKNYS